MSDKSERDFSRGGNIDPHLMRGIGGNGPEIEATDTANSTCFTVFPDAGGEISEDCPSFSYVLLCSGNVAISCSSTDTTIEVPAEEVEFFLTTVRAIPEYLENPIYEPTPGLPVVCLDE